MNKIIENTKADFLIDVETVTPLLQIEPSSGEKDFNTKASMVKTKKMKFVGENGSLCDAAFFSANGLRGINRRNIASAIFGELQRKDGQKVSVDTVHLYASGGGTSVNNFHAIFGKDEKLNYVEETKFREQNPFISLFGAGLSDIDGKLSVSDISPVERDKKLTDFLYGVRFEETERKSILTPLLDAQSIEEYQKELEVRRSANSSVRKKEDEIEKLEKQLKAISDKTSTEYISLSSDISLKREVLEEELKDKGMSYQQVYKAEFIIPHTKMSSSVGTRGGYELTDIEKAMVLFGLIKTSQQNIGSYSRIGWGAMDWHVKDGSGETLFVTKCNEQYVLNKSTELTEKGRKILAPFEDYLNGLTRDNIFLP